VKVQISFKRFKYVSLILLALSCVPHATRAQDWIKTGTGLGLEKPRVAVADFAPRVDPAKNHSALFTQVVRDDLQFSGILDLVSPNFYRFYRPDRTGLHCSAIQQVHQVGRPEH
jgi:hypothetical protein